MPEQSKFEDVDLFASLNAVMKQNTGFYQSDLEIDKEIIAKAAASPGLTGKNGTGTGVARSAVPKMGIWWLPFWMRFLTMAKTRASARAVTPRGAVPQEKKSPVLPGISLLRAGLPVPRSAALTARAGLAALPVRLWAGRAATAGAARSAGREITTG